MTTTSSPKWSVNAADIAKGLVFAVVTAIITLLAQSFSKGIFTIDWAAILHTGEAAGATFLIGLFASGEKAATPPAQ